MIRLYTPGFEINEGASVPVTASFYLDMDVAYTPLTVSYRVDSLTYGTSILPLTAITPAPAISFNISGTINTITAAPRDEMRQITVITTSSTGNTEVETVNYRLRNLLGIGST